MADLTGIFLEKLSSFSEFKQELEEVKTRIDEIPLQLNSAGFDPWGADLQALKTAASVVYGFYRHYFRVQTRGISNIPAGRVLLVSNHGGQIPIDALMITASLIFEGTPPRLARGLVDRWVPSVPFVSTFFSRCGQVIGDPQNGRDLLNQNECVLVFPEGTKGSGKTIFERYELQRFGTGFIRLALETKAPIVPVAVLGCEEAYPSLTNFRSLAKLIGAPYFPVTPLFPLLGPLGMVPLPTRVTIRFAKPLSFETDPDAPDAEIQKIVEKIRSVIQSELSEGLKKRNGDLFHGTGV